MWDTIQTHQVQHLSHDRPCAYCGHPGHHFLPCDRECGCQPAQHN